MCIFHSGTGADDLDRPSRCLYWVYPHTYICIILVNLKLRHLFGPRALSLNASCPLFRLPWSAHLSVGSQKLRVGHPSA